MWLRAEWTWMCLIRMEPADRCGFTAVKQTVQSGILAHYGGRALFNKGHRATCPTGRPEQASRRPLCRWAPCKSEYRTRDWGGHALRAVELGCRARCRRTEAVSRGPARRFPNRRRARPCGPSCSWEQPKARPRPRARPNLTTLHRPVWEGARFASPMVAVLDSGAFVDVDIVWDVLLRQSSSFAHRHRDTVSQDHRCRSRFDAAAG